MKKIKDCEIKIVLHHDYLKIEDKRKKQFQSLQMPIRTAKLIHDMWESSGSIDEDIKNYAVGDGYYSAHGVHFTNPIYDLSIFNRNVKRGSVFSWIVKMVDKI